MNTQNLRCVCIVVWSVLAVLCSAYAQYTEAAAWLGCAAFNVHIMILIKERVAIEEKIDEVVEKIKSACLK